MGRRFGWVHVVDHSDIEDSLSGGELLLTSGVTLAAETASSGACRIDNHLLHEVLEYGSLR